MRRFFTLLFSFLILILFLTGFQKQAYAISYYLPDFTVGGALPSLVIGRLADSNGIAVPQTSAKLIYENIPDKVYVFDGPYCASSQYDNHTGSANSPCTSTNLNGEVYFDFQALNNDTGQVGTVRRVKGSTMAAGGGVNGSYAVDLTGLDGITPSTEGKYFVKVTVSWALQNNPLCTKDSSISSNCRTGTNAFIFILPRQTDLATYASTITDSSPLAILTAGPQTKDTDFSDHIFQFAVPCNASNSQLQQLLKWQDADYGQNNQQGNIAWYLIDDSAAGGAKIVATLANAALGGQNETRTYSYKFELNHKYRWYWQHVQNNNGIQAWLPFDSYNYAIDCSVKPTPNPTPTVTYKISGTIFTDSDSNGSQDVSESNYAGAPTISISPNNAGTISTSPDGSYTISNLRAGTYVVSYNSLPTGYHMTFPLNGPPPSFQVTVGPGCNVSNAAGASCQ